MTQRVRGTESSPHPNTMEHPRIDEEHVGDRYLAGELSDDDVEAFEEHLFECEACLEAVEWGEELRRGVRSVGANADFVAGVDDDSIPDQPVEIRPISKPWLASPAGSAAFGAMALALLALGFVTIRQNGELTRLRDLQPQAPPGVAAGFDEPTADFQVASLGVVRDGSATEIRLDPARSVVLLSLELPDVTAATYQVTLFDDAGQVVWQGAGLEPSLYDTLIVALPSSFLSRGSYRIAAQDSNGTQGGEFEFSLTGPP